MIQFGMPALIELDAVEDLAALCAGTILGFYPYT